MSAQYLGCCKCVVVWHYQIQPLLHKSLLTITLSCGYICVHSWTFFTLSSHIKEHLKEVTDVKEDAMSDEDLQFHYFKLHDYDNNNKLDGIELGNAMTHFHDEEGTNQETTSSYSDEQLANMIDQILEEDDLNKDGYIDYTEFVGAQKRVDESPAEKTAQ